MYVQPLDGSLGPNAPGSTALNAETEGAPFAGALPATGDNISRFVPPWSDDGGQPPYGGYGGSGSLPGLFAPLMGVLQQVMQMLQSLTGYGCNSPFGGGACTPYGNEQFFQNATGASDGDPHLSFNGARWNNMASQPDLLSSNSFAGGFRISTDVTPVDPKGVTWNQSAAVSMNNGATTIGLNNQGQPTIVNDGQSLSIARGQTLQLGNGESVTCEQNGSLRVCAQNGVGGRIDTTLTAQGHGVNVDVTAHDVDLGGALINGYERRQIPIISNPISNPILGPFPQPAPEPQPASTTYPSL